MTDSLIINQVIWFFDLSPSFIILQKDIKGFQIFSNKDTLPFRIYVILSIDKQKDTLLIHCTMGGFSTSFQYIAIRHFACIIHISISFRVLHTIFSGKIAKIKISGFIGKFTDTILKIGITTSFQKLPTYSPTYSAKLSHFLTFIDQQV